MEHEKVDLHLNSHHKRRKKPEISLFRRKGQPYWYFYQRQDGKRIAKSTGQTTKVDALDAARAILTPKPKGSEVTFGTFADDFFVWGKCAWIAAQHAAGRPFSKGAAIGRRTHLTTWILPRFKDRTIGSITPAELRDWIISLPLSGQSKNHIKYTLKAIFAEAVFAELIERNPAEMVKNVALNRKDRDPFTLEDLGMLFPFDEPKLLKIWGDIETATAFCVLASTGIREGEVRALMWKHYHPERSALIIEQATKFYEAGIGSTKSGKARPVFVRSRAKTMLDTWRTVVPWNDPDDLIFPSSVQGRPIHDQTFRDRLRRAVKAAEIPTEGRNLVVHSFRHGYVTRMKEQLPAAALMLTTGHADDKTSRQYFHPSVEDFLKQIDQTGKLIEAAWTTDW